MKKWSYVSHSVLFAAIFALAFALLAPMSLTQAAEQARPTLSVSGSGRAEQAPDQATVSIGITTYAKDAAKAQAENATKAQSIQQAVRTLGIPAKDIATSNYSFSPTYRTEQNHQNEINGYQVNNTVTIKVNDLSLTGKVIDAALSHGANEISSLSFGAKDFHAARQEALSSAVKDAREKADIIAKALGKHIIGVQKVTENVSVPSSRRYDGNMILMAKAASASVPTPVEAGTLSVQASVHIDFLIGD